MKRILNYVSFAISAFIYAFWFAKRPDIIYAYQPPLTVGIAASLVKLLRRVPVVYDIQDMWPDTLRATGMLNNSFALNSLAYLCRWVYSQMNHIVVLSPGFKRLLLKRGVPADKLSVIYNWADEASLASSFGNLPSIFSNDDRFRILFAGNMGFAQALDTVLEAASILQSRHNRISWLMLGGGVELCRLKAEAQKRGLSNVVFLPAVPMSEVGAISILPMPYWFTSARTLFLKLLFLPKLRLT